MGVNNSDSKMTSYGLNDRNSIPGSGGILIYPSTSRQILGSTQISVQLVQLILYPEIKLTTADC